MKKNVVYVLVALCCVGSVNATMIQGSDAFVLFSVTPNTGNINTCTTINWSMMLTSSAGTGDLSSIPAMTSMTTWTALDLGNLTAFSFGKNPGFGTWVTTGGSFTRPSSGYLSVTLTGIFTPSFGGFDASPGTANFSFNPSGSGTFAVTPEPVTIAMLGLGAMGLIRRKRAV